MKTLLMISILLGLVGCIYDPIDLSNSVDCTAENFVGIWKYQPTNVILEGSQPDIEISMTDNPNLGDIIVDGIYQPIKSVGSCIAGNPNGILDQSFELKSDHELIRRTSVFIFVQHTELFIR